jgi:deoxyribonuclease-4
MRRLGVHTSIAGGLHLSLQRAQELGCSTVQIFSHNPRGWEVKQILEEDARKFRSLRNKYNISPIYIHTSYLINMASWNRHLRKKSIDLLVIEMKRADILGADFVILHTGSASGKDSGLSRKKAIEALHEVSQRGRWKARLLIENTSGERGDIASDIVCMSEILNGVADGLISGICIDTCHAFSAGYHIGEHNGIRRFSNDIKKYIGLGNVKLIHLNDSKGDIGSGVDRHEHIGLGKIGATGLKRFIQSSLFKKVPLILETPKKKETDDVRNLRIVREMINNPK